MVARVEFLRSSLADQRSATLILAAAVVFSLVWANVASATYDAFWTARVAFWIDGHCVGLSTREVVNQGLMSFFFLVVGLEARREWDLGDLRDRRRSMLPLSIGLAGLILPATIFAVVNVTFAGGNPGAWGTAMSTDTAMALGALPLIARGATLRLRQLLITVLVADDIGSPVVIAAVYSGEVRVIVIAATAGVFVWYWWLQRTGLPGSLLAGVAASGAAAAQDAFWPMHDALLAHRADLEDLDLVGLAGSLGLDTGQFVADFESARTAHKVAADVESERLNGVAGTPTLFINGVRHEGDYGPAALLAAVHMVLQPEERPQAE